MNDDGLSVAIEGVLSDAVSGGSFEIAQLIDRVIERAGDAYSVHADRLARNGLHKTLRDRIRALTEQSSEQAQLPGFKFPSVIAVGREDGEYTYVPIAVASYDDACAGLATKEANVLRVERQRDEYAATLDRLRVWMAFPTAPDGGLPAPTVLEAMRRIKQFEHSTAA